MSSTAQLDPQVIAIRDGLAPGSAGAPDSLTWRAWWQTVQSVRLTTYTGASVQGVGVEPASPAMSVVANQYPEAVALWLAVSSGFNIDASSGVSIAPSDVQARLPQYMAALGISDDNATAFGNAWYRYVAEIGEARQAVIDAEPATLAWQKNALDFQAAAARGTVYAGPNQLTWPAEYVQEGPVTFPDGNVYMVIYDPRNTDKPDGISVLWWKGPTWRAATVSFPSADPYSVTRWNLSQQPQNIAGRNPWIITGNGDLIQQPDPGTGDWYFVQWESHDAASAPAGWVLDNGALISPRAKDSLQLPAYVPNQVPYTPSTVSRNPPPPTSTTLPPSPIQPTPIFPTSGNGTGGAQQNIGGGLNPSAIQQDTTTAPGIPVALKVAGGIALGLLVLYLLTRAGE